MQRLRRTRLMRHAEKKNEIKLENKKSANMVTLDRSTVTKYSIREGAQSKSQEIRSHAEIVKNQTNEARTLKISEIVKEKTTECK
jgi:hypothetical protein